MKTKDDKTFLNLSKDLTNSPLVIFSNRTGTTINTKSLHWCSNHRPEVFVPRRNGHWKGRILASGVPANRLPLT